MDQNSIKEYLVAQTEEMYQNSIKEYLVAQTEEMLGELFGSFLLYDLETRWSLPGEIYGKCEIDDSGFYNFHISEKEGILKLSHPVTKEEKLFGFVVAHCF